MFAATAATIVSGAVAERIKLSLVHDLLDDLRGARLHDRGLLEVGRRLPRRHGLLRLRRLDARALGRRLGRAGRACCCSGRASASTPRARSSRSRAATCRWPTIGVFLLWLGWFGFNGGSVLSADPALTSFVLVTTCLAAAAGAIGAMFTSWIVTSKPDLSMALNGILAGLVGITAGADVDERRRRDRDRRRSPASSWSARCCSSTASRSTTRSARSRCTWSAASGARWPSASSRPTRSTAFMIQLDRRRLLRRLHAVACAFALFVALKATMGIRVSEEEELEGLDLGEHGMHAYDLHARPGWLEQQPGIPARPAPAVATTQPRHRTRTPEQNARTRQDRRRHEEDRSDHQTVQARRRQGGPRQISTSRA